MKRHTVVVESTLAFRMQRVEAARNDDHGLDITTLPLLAARLAGGFVRPADHATLMPIIASALHELAFDELDPVKARPGMARAVLASLERMWAANIRFDDPAFVGPRLSDLGRIEVYLRERLAEGQLLPRDLRDRALSRVTHARAVTGAIHLHRLVSVDPLWRPLIGALASVVETTWDAPGRCDRSWFPGKMLSPPLSIDRPMICEVCADPRAEVVEALRWARALLSDGVTKASDIAITSTDLSTWDDHMLVLASQGDLPVHFASGITALSTRAGQTCAALADAMINGLSQDRIRRLSLLSPYLSETLATDWMKAIPSEAGLFEPEHWARSLHGLTSIDGAVLATILMPILQDVADGPKSALRLGTQLLRGKSLGLWQEALRRAPAAAMEMTLASLRVADEKDPVNHVVWARAADLVGAPRKHMRLVGLSGRTWPRGDSADPLLPDHILGARALVDLSRLDRDRLSFEILSGHPAAQITLSRSRRSAEGTVLARSALLERSIVERPLSRTRSPEHAFSEGDRLLARTSDAEALPRIRRVISCWTSWTRRPEITAHDGGFRKDHPAVMRALSLPQSATSLRRLLRDPLGFVWLKVLGMTAPELAVQPLQLDPAAFGELVHEMLRLAVDMIEPLPGLVRATPVEIDNVLEAAAESIATRWPLSQPVPPRLLWLDTIAEARRRARRGLTVDDRFGPGTRSFSEVLFGTNVSQAGRVEPWLEDQEVLIGRSGIRLKGRIDRIDVKPDRRGVRMSDYKTGTRPRDLHGIVIDGGREVQRALYAAAIKQLMPEASTIISRLVYLDTMEPPANLAGDALENAVTTLLDFINVAVEALRAGAAYPGPDAFANFNDLRIALPAALDSYQRRKDENFDAAQHELARLWAER
ncbi:PD-(D/E)XK nuclease family protein [Mesorhizobium sp. M4B.F.Ca.ET.013.02.1.1]|uniref:PD-(D/E)XK nuclease family protein n=1 Tax=Mesorhizobium sp. M4B.F.Ca.ET.013.02.1.1 TaxID=2496755 RepID=UPI000FD37AFE|nr:PD-(D/E)XK nuclease family protein [Mesorhizobium sp. M4B.F.Ca.ET.013.02.1.1]RUW19725.1 PD-(D/E)XK nuclease family protein [Mesorhizobium sp. M4B.F.Ca.ET.013.02.1.1]